MPELSAEAIIMQEAAKDRVDIQHLAHDDTMGVALVLVDVDPATGRAVYECPAQKIDFFAFGTDDSFNDRLGPYKKTAAETSLSKGRETPNKSNMAITGLSMARRGIRTKVETADLGDVRAGLANSESWKAMLRGEIEIIDRSGLFLPFEFGGHPGFLEDVLDGIRSRGVFTPKFGKKTSGDPIRADRIPCGDATSGLRAAGDPMNMNRYSLPIGYLWRASNKSQDSEFSLQLEITKAFLLTVNCPRFGLNDGDPVKYVAPPVIMVDFTTRVHGKSASPVSTNAALRPAPRLARTWPPRPGRAFRPSAVASEPPP